MEVGGRHHAPAAFTPGKDGVPIVQEAGWAPGPVWTGAENLYPTGIRSPDRPVRSESLYRLSYPGPCRIHQYSLLYNMQYYEYWGECRYLLIKLHEFNTWIAYAHLVLLSYYFMY